MTKIYHKRNCDWNADDIDSILETLEKNEVKITFFMVGTWIDKYPEAVKKINEAGHEIGSHSNTHPHVNDIRCWKKSRRNTIKYKQNRKNNGK